MDIFLAGMITGFNCVVALVFMRFWVQTRDRLFLWFSIAFLAARPEPHAGHDRPRP